MLPVGLSLIYALLYFLVIVELPQTAELPEPDELPACHDDEDDVEPLLVPESSFIQVLYLLSLFIFTYSLLSFFVFFCIFRSLSLIQYILMMLL